jgi:hypothetical protein
MRPRPGVGSHGRRSEVHPAPRWIKASAANTPPS